MRTSVLFSASDWPAETNTGSTDYKSVKVEGSRGLKASEMLDKMCGWNEPERVNVQSVEVKVDAALIAQLRAGYAEINALGSRGGVKLGGAPIGAGDGNTPLGG